MHVHTVHVITLVWHLLQCTSHKASPHWQTQNHRSHSVSIHQAVLNLGPMKWIHGDFHDHKKALKWKCDQLSSHPVWMYAHITRNSFYHFWSKRTLSWIRTQRKKTTYSCKYYCKKSNVKLDIMWCSRRRNLNNHGKAWHLYILWAISEFYKISKPICINWLLVLKLHHYSYKKFKHRFTIISGHLPTWQISWFTWQTLSIRC